ncbi:MAG TPA: DUF72 domain-containing protein [Actinomycetota bacterium]|nr:DUF72 domain-containing protein [Actinomycetota bacterium]
MPVLIGTSGWQYRDWRDRFYPRSVPQKSWLEYYAERFRTVESNNAFYMLPKPETFESWRKRTPDDFMMAVKVNRYITHIRRLRDAREPVERFTSNARNLGAKLGPLLLQLPPNLRADPDSLKDVLEGLCVHGRVAVEFRHDSWYIDEVRDILAERNVALCLADRGSRRITPLWRTASWGYLRFHWGVATPEPCYGRSALRSWARRLADNWAPTEDVYAFFNNDPRGCALRDARLFARDCERAGLTATRVPQERVMVS